MKKLLISLFLFNSITASMWEDYAPMLKNASSAFTSRSTLGNLSVRYGLECDKKKLLKFGKGLTAFRFDSETLKKVPRLGFRFYYDGVLVENNESCDLEPSFRIYDIIFEEPSAVEVELNPFAFLNH